MDGKGGNNGSVMDVRPPGTAAAPPTSKPVFTNNQTPQADPMMAVTPNQYTNPVNTQAPSPPTAPESVPIPESAATPMPEPQLSTAPLAGAPTVEGADMSHQFSHDQPMYGQFKKRGKGKKMLIFLLVLIILGSVAFAAWYFLKPKPVAAPASSTQQKLADNVTKNSVVIPEGFVVYKNKDYGFSFAYPKTWSEPKFSTDVDILKAQNPTQKYNDDDVSELSVNFDNPKLQVNLLISPFIGGRDYPDCDPSQNYEATILATVQKSLIGWDIDNLIYAEKSPTAYFTYKELITEHHTKLSSKNKVLVYKSITSVFKADPACKISQADADKASEYNNIIYFAANFTNTQIKGVNAQYWADKTPDQTVIDQVVTSLNTLQKTAN